MIRKVTKQQLEQRLKERSPEYLKEITPAIVKAYADGSMDFETEHPAWVAAMVKHRPVREAMNQSPPQNTKCKFASCGCGKKPIKCNQLGNLGNICPNPHDKECEYRSGSEAKPLPFFSKRKAICNECILDKIKCPIVHEEGCAINRILNDPKHECPHKAWNREPDYIFYTLNGFKVNETDYKLKKEKS